MIVLERYGHDLNIAQGGPVEIFVPGTGGTATVKNLVGIKFSKTDNPPVYSDIAVPSIEAGALINMNTSWFDNDGVQAKVGDPGGRFLGLDLRRCLQLRSGQNPLLPGLRPELD